MLGILCRTAWKDRNEGDCVLYQNVCNIAIVLHVCVSERLDENVYCHSIYYVCNEGVLDSGDFSHGKERSVLKRISDMVSTLVYL